MSDSRATSDYTISADPSRFTAGMERASESARNAARDIRSSMQAIEGHMGQLSGALSSVTRVFGGLTAIIAGGSAFKEVIGQANEWTGEAKKLSAQLGVTTERASVMMVAMRHLGLDSEVVTKASTNMAKHMVANADAFEKLGVKVRDSSGQYRAPIDIMGELNQKLRDIKNPIEQNIAGMQIYGESWSEVRGVLKLTTEEIKLAEQKAKDLGLVVGDESVANTKKYKEAINDMKLVVTSLEVQVGSVLLPVFVRLGSWLSGVGPTAGKVMGLVLESLGNIIATLSEVVVEIWQLIVTGFSEIGNIIAETMGGKAPSAMEFFANCLKVIEIAFLGFKVAIQLAVAGIVASIEYTVAGIMRLATVAERVLHLDFGGAKQAWAAGTSNLEDIERKHFDKMLGIAAQGRGKLDEIISRGPKANGVEIKDKAPASGGPTYQFKDKDEKAKSRFGEWDAKLAADKDGYAKQQALAGTAMEYSMSQEADYWKRILASKTMSSEEKTQVERKYFTVLAAIRKEQFETEIAGERLKLEDFKNNHLERMEIANRLYEQNVARFGAESKEAKAALADVYKEQRAYADQAMATNKVVAEARRNAELAGIDAAEQDAEQQLALRQITAGRLLEMEQQFEAKRFEIKMQALLAQQEAMKGPDQDPVALAQLHSQIESLEQQHQLKLTQIRNKSALNQRQTTDAVYGAAQSGLANVLASTAKGTMTLAQAMQSMLQTVAGAVIDMAAKTASEWVMNMLLANGASKATSVGQISANAGVAGAAATASAAAIPLYGWAIAPEAGMAASAAAMAFMPLASARGGYDIPAGVNPLTQLHEKEMVLPQAQADAVRSMAEGGGGAGQTINYHDHSGKLSPAEIRRNARVIAEALKDYAKK